MVASCRNGVNDKVLYNSNDTIKKSVLDDKNKIKYTTVFLFYKNGEIKEIQRYNDKGELSGEQLWFDSNGNLDKKIPLINGIAKGNGYYFYDTTGTLAGHRYFRNDITVFHGADYWEDSIGMIKSILYFNDSGNIYYKKNFDKNGNFINEEGKK